MAENSYPIEVKQAHKNGYYTPQESNNSYALDYARTTYITHWWGAPGSVGNHDQTVDYILGQASAGNMSVNYVVSDDKITMIVPPDMVSWGAGPKGNPIGINVEHQPTLGPEGYKKAGWLLDQLEKRFGKGLSVTRHSDYMSTQCCGTIDTGRIRAEADKWKRGEYDRPPAPLWTTEPYNRTVRIKPGSRKWNLGHGNFTDVANNPITIAGADEIVNVTAILHHREIPQYNYYLEDANTPHGWNVLDCMDYVAPPPPYVPPAPPVLPTLAEKYTVVTRLMAFNNADDARTRQNVQRDIEPGEYYVFSKLDKYYNLTDSNVHNRNWWVNTVDNKIPEIPVNPEIPTIPVDIVKPEIELVDLPPSNPPVIPPKLQFEMMQPINMEAINAVPEVFPDLEGKTQVKAQLNPGSIKEYSMRTFKDGEEYWIPTLSMKRGWRHGVPRDMLDYPQILPAYSPFDTNKDGQIKWDDFVDYGSKLINSTRTAAIKVVTSPKVAQVKQRTGKLIDGFTARKTKK